MAALCLGSFTDSTQARRTARRPAAINIICEISVLVTEQCCDYRTVKPDSRGGDKPSSQRVKIDPAVPASILAIVHP